MNRYCADFETTTDENDCRVWAYAIINIDNENDFIYGNNIEDFIQWFIKNPSTLYFHNLKFDCEFLISYLFNHGWQWTNNRKEMLPGQFTTLISDKGQFYSCEICTGTRGKKLKFTRVYDSLKILPMSVEKIASGFNLPISKLKIDYELYREPGHKLTAEEIAYIRNDVTICAKALKTLFEHDLKQITQGSNALYDFKKIFGQDRFERDFPVPSYDADIRQAYKGGYTYLKEGYSDIDLGEGIVLDVNSLYPWVLYTQLLPFGEGIHFKGKYINDKIYPLFIQMFKCQFDLKEGYLPTVQIKHGNGFNPVEYLKNSNNEQVTLCLTNVDIELFFKHYNVTDIEYISGWKFRGATGLFKDYIDKWIKIKIESSINGNQPMRQLAKLMLNALYGKFALNPNVRSKMPYMDKDGIIRYKNLDWEIREPIYIPIGVFTTAYARQKTISTAQLLYDRFIYSDTDSLHLLGKDLPNNIKIDDNELGAWKHEKTFCRARFIRSKCYIEEVEKYDKNAKDYYKELEITCAGMPERCYKEEYEDSNGKIKERIVNVTWDNFHPAAVYGNKLQFKHVKGGIVLKPIDFTIRM